MAAKNSVLPIRFLQLEKGGLHLFIRARCGKKFFSMLIDTGASNTVMDEKFFLKTFPMLKADNSGQRSTGLGTSSMKMKTAVFKKISFGSVAVQTFSMALLDLSHVNLAYESLGHPPVEAVLGSDLLLYFSARIDYGKKKLLLKQSRS